MAPGQRHSSPGAPSPFPPAFDTLLPCPVPAPLIPARRSLIVSCEQGDDSYLDLIGDTAGVAAVGGYKIGAVPALTWGLPQAVERARRFTDKPLIYDHQKAGADIPDTAAAFCAAVAAGGLDSVIVMPHSGPATQRALIGAARGNGLYIIAGGCMTHNDFLRGDGGYLADDTPERAFDEAAGLGVEAFVVPATRPDFIARLDSRLEARGVRPCYYSPGFLTQGGDRSALAAAPQRDWHVIVGRYIYQAGDYQKAAEQAAEALFG